MADNLDLGKAKSLGLEVKDFAVFAHDKTLEPSRQLRSDQASLHRVEVSCNRVEIIGFRVWGLGFRVEDSCSRVEIILSSRSRVAP